MLPTKYESVKTTKKILKYVNAILSWLLCILSFIVLLNDLAKKVELSLCHKLEYSSPSIFATWRYFKLCFKLWLHNLKEFIVWNIYGLRHLGCKDRGIKILVCGENSMSLELQWFINVRKQTEYYRLGSLILCG